MGRRNWDCSGFSNHEGGGPRIFPSSAPSASFHRTGVVLSGVSPSAPASAKAAAFDFGLKREAEEGADRGGYGAGFGALGRRLELAEAPAFAGEQGCVWGRLGAAGASVSG